MEFTRHISLLTHFRDQAFAICSKLTDIYFLGTIEQWNSITFEDNWCENTPLSTIHCTDGDIVKS